MRNGKRHKRDLWQRGKGRYLASFFVPELKKGWREHCPREVHIAIQESANLQSTGFVWAIEGKKAAFAKQREVQRGLKQECRREGSEGS